MEEGERGKKQGAWLHRESLPQNTNEFMMADRGVNQVCGFAGTTCLRASSPLPVSSPHPATWSGRGRGEKEGSVGQTYTTPNPSHFPHSAVYTVATAATQPNLNSALIH